MIVRSKRFDSFFRRWVPSTATLSHNVLFKIAGRISDFGWNLVFPEFRQLPPNHLRVRVGVGNQLFRNQILCLHSGTNYWMNAFADGLCKLDSKIVEIGCGYGRKAYHLLNYEVQGKRFEGTYLGVDIDDELLAFGRKKFPSPQFVFQLTPHKSDTYKSGKPSSETSITKSDSSNCRIEREDSSQDFVFSTSLLTHLLEPELANYVAESFRVLKPGGTMQMNFFCLDFLRDSGHLGSRWTFPHSIGKARVENLTFPEAAVAYDAEDMVAFCRQAGFATVEVISDRTGKMVQSFIRAMK